MYPTLLQAHSGLAYVALLALLFAFFNSLAGSMSKRNFSTNDRRFALFALIAAHLQFAVGMFLYFVSPNGFDKLQALGMAGMSAAERLLAVEHPFVNLMAIVLITAGWSSHKRALPERKNKQLAIFYGIGLLLLLSRIPWFNWLP